ncbi:MAG: FliG C-terminal domain-containing protein [Phycisphaerae bacterium]|nr:FliG C-terminal domain-containing protein [Phycisphaerae bacterium]
MALTGKQKAALLLSTLDASMAAELLKGADENVVRDLAVELTYLDISGHCHSDNTLELAREFCMTMKKSEKPHTKSFLDKLLRSSLGNEKAANIQTQISELLHLRDPFIPIKQANNSTLIAVLNGEHPQAAAVVLSELDAKRSSELLGMLKEQLRLTVISRMTGVENISADAKRRIAAMVSQKITELQSGSAGVVVADKKQSYRKVAVVMRNLAKELRDGLIESMKKTDEQACKQITDLMIIWEDITQVADRSLQEALRGVEPQKMALALFKTDEKITAKIRANISERAAAMIDEETSLMSSPKKEDIEQAKEDIVSVLREMNAKGELVFIE